MNDYVCWSAPVDDLSAWRYEGVIYRKNQDPRNRLGIRLLFAPDVTRGLDGRYYLYYAFDVMGIMGVAVAGEPAGPFEFLGHVSYPDGTIWGRKSGDSFPFDPGVLLDDDGRVYLYSGFSRPISRFITGGRKLRSKGGYVLELESDMVTIRTPEKLLLPKVGPGSFEGHEFFEASSIRKYDGTYYLVYSSGLNHELCYAVSDSPIRGFRFGGTLVSNGDVGINGHHDDASAANYTGNTHGGLLRMGDDFFIFYHRQTNLHSSSRQACAERLARRPDGGFDQVEMTSCGLNGGSLEGSGAYEARIACNLWSAEGAGRYDRLKERETLKRHPYFTQDERDGEPGARQYIANMRDGATAGFKYFALRGLTGITATVRGDAAGFLRVSSDPEGHTEIARIRYDVQRNGWVVESASAIAADGVSALYFTFIGTGAIDFLSFELGAHNVE